METNGSGKSKPLKLETLRDAVERYVANAPDLRSATKLRHNVNRWEKHASAKLPITDGCVERFRASCVAAKLSPTTIETTVSDVLTILRGTKCKVPSAGRRLRKPIPTAEQPSTEDIGKVYAIARSARFPRRTVNGNRCYDGASGKQQCWRDWSDQDRLRFWQTLIVLMARAGLPIGDFRQLKWEHVTADRLEWLSGRSQRRIAMTPEIKRHLDSVRGLDPIYVLPIAKWSVRFIRRELNKLRRKAGVKTWGILREKDLEKVYAQAGAATYPARTFNGDTVGCWRFWSDDDRERFWRALLFLGYWTGLRIGDLRRLTWASVFTDRIEWKASKTDVAHVFPVTADVQRHLDMVRGLDSVYVVPIARGSLRFIRKELSRLCRLAGVESFGPQKMRRASVTEWGCTTNDAGALIHGCGLGIRRHYVNPLKVLSRASERFELPEPMRDATASKSNGRKNGNAVEPIKTDSFSTTLAAICSLPLSDAEKAAAVRRLMTEQTAG